jgi:predicted transcriptional regulator
LSRTEVSDSIPRDVAHKPAESPPVTHRAAVRESAPLRDLIEELRRMERLREDATPGSSEYIELVGFERQLVDRIRDRIERLDTGPDWTPTPTGRGA